MRLRPRALAAWSARPRRANASALGWPAMTSRPAATGFRNEDAVVAMVSPSMELSKIYVGKPLGLVSFGSPSRAGQSPAVGLFRNGNSTRTAAKKACGQPG